MDKASNYAKGHHRWKQLHELAQGCTDDLEGKGSVYVQEGNSFLVSSTSWVMTALQLTLLQSRIKAFLSVQPKAMTPPRAKRIFEILDSGTSNKAGNEESS